MRKPGMSADGAVAGNSNGSSPETVPTGVFEQTHEVELSVRRELLAEPGLRFSSLVVRRVPDGVCLEGVMEVDDGTADIDTAADIGSLARRVAGVQNVLNHLVTHAPPSPPPKG